MVKRLIGLLILIAFFAVLAQTASAFVYQDVTIATTENIGTARTLKINVDYDTGMRTDFADVFFMWPNNTEIPRYLDNSSVVPGQNATFYLFFENIFAVNDFYMCWDSGLRSQNPNVFFNLYDYSSGQLFSATTTFNVYNSSSLYGVSNSANGNYTHAEIVYSVTGTGQNHSTAPWIRIYGATVSWMETAGAWVEKDIVFSVVGSWNNTSIVVTPSSIIHLISVSTGTSANIVISVNNDKYTHVNTTFKNVTNVFVFNKGGAADLLLYSAKFYNSTNFTIVYKNKHNDVVYIITGNSPVTVNNMPISPQTYPQGAVVTVAGNPTTTDKTDGSAHGTWAFDGWTSADTTITGSGDTFIMPGNSVMITGSWTFTPTHSNFEPIEFTQLYDQYFVSDLSNWNLLEMSHGFFVNSVGSLILWFILFVAVYTALHLTAGGISIPAAVFAATGMILVHVMPLELSTWAYLLVAAGLFILPAYRYFKN